ncbi:MAG: ATP-binding cassette domain-containing protein [Candidatus Kaistia colombiensis]|nr:MAG: ATP-binding cassette domain-containing protein [Kaistia sp.]
MLASLSLRHAALRRRYSYRHPHARPERPLRPVRRGSFMNAPVLAVRNLTKLFADAARPDAMPVGVRGVSLEVARGEVVGLIGESGCGKTTLGRCIARLLDPDSGEVLVRDVPFSALKGHSLRNFRKNVQVVFQKPETCLNPRMTVAVFVREALRNFGIVANNAEARKRLVELASLVGLREAALEQYPHQLSGGERQRVAIMRALACEPELIVLDEPTSALDVSVQAQVLRTLKDLQTVVGTSFLFISHDVAVIRYMCARVLVMYLGVVVEEGPVEAVFGRPAHPYTRALLAAAPRIKPRAVDPIALRGELMLGDVRLDECPVRVRCPLAHARCVEAPPEFDLGDGHRSACWLSADTASRSVSPTAMKAAS